MAENQTQLGKSKSQLHVLLPYWGTVWLPLVLCLVGDWFQLDSVRLDPPREFLVDIQVLAEQINTSLP